MFLQTPTPEPPIKVIKFILEQRANTELIPSEIIPFITFLLGAVFTALLTFGKDYIDRRREIDNLKTILFYELFFNYTLSYNISWQKPNGEVQYLFKFIENFSEKVYEVNLNRLSVLSSSELSFLMSSYANINQLFDLRDRIQVRLEGSKYDKTLEPIANQQIIDNAKHTASEIQKAIKELDEEKANSKLEKFHKKTPTNY